MKAIIQDRYGTDDVLELRDVDRPTIGDADVLLRVEAAGVDQGVWHLMSGRPYLVRLAGYGLRAPKTRVRGHDVAGTVVGVGAEVDRFRVGDEVFGTCDGAFAEYARAEVGSLAPRPANLTAEQAASVPTSGCTALAGLRKGDVRDGRRTLIIGAAGGVGTYAVQLAKVLGAEVTGVCSTAKVDLVESLGADRVIDYTTQEVTESGERWDTILDIAGNRPLSRLRRILEPAGTLVIVGGEEGGRWIGGTDRQLRAMLLSPFVRQTLRSFIATPSAVDLEVLAGLIEAGSVTPAVDRTFPLAEAPAAIRYVREGRVRGKVVVTA